MPTISHFARFKGGFKAPLVDDAIGLHETTLLAPAKYIHEQLDSRNINCTEPKWQGYEYILICTLGDRKYEVSISYDFVDWEWFELGYQPTLGFLARLTGQREEREMAQLSASLDAALHGKTDITEVRWYRVPLDKPDGRYSRHSERF